MMQMEQSHFQQSKRIQRFSQLETMILMHLNQFRCCLQIFVGTDCTGGDIKTDKLTNLVGHATVVARSRRNNLTFVNNIYDVTVRMNGGSTADKGRFTITALEDNGNLVVSVLIGTGTKATPFAA